MTERLSSRNAKNRVVSVCEVLAASNPNIPDRRIQDAAIDLHDIEASCERCQSMISRLRRHDPKDKDQTRAMLIGIDFELFDELCHHIRSLKRFFKSIGIRD